MGNVNDKSKDELGGLFLVGDHEPTLDAIAAFIREWENKDAIEVTTSGSTGIPKKISIPKASMIESARQTIAFFDITADQRLLLCLPVNFIAGKMMLVRALVSGAQLAICEPTVNPLLNISVHKIRFAAFTPQQVAAILSNEETREKFIHINKVIIGGGEIPALLEKKLAALPNYIYATYGMTETITHIAVRKIGTASKIYKVFKGITISIDERQCLTIQAPYLANEVIVTNDIVELEGPHEFTWLGRYDNVVNSGGIKLFPEKTEEKIRDILPHDFFMAGVPDDSLGERMILVIEAAPYDDITLGLLQKTLRDVLDKYEVPKEIVFVPVFERTETNKIKRKESLNKGFNQS